MGLHVLDVSNPYNPINVSLLAKEVDSDEYILGNFIQEGVSLYPQVRKLILDLGWNPVPIEDVSNLWEPQKSYFKQGWIECQDCSGSGLGFCKFLFINPETKKHLAVVTAGILENGNGIPVLYSWWIE